jgi:hypothetical protein
VPERDGVRRAILVAVRGVVRGQRVRVRRSLVEARGEEAHLLDQDAAHDEVAPVEPEPRACS